MNTRRIITKISFFAITVLFMLVSRTESYAQLSLTNAAPSQTIDFSSTISGVSNGTYTAAGFQLTPATGQLDSDAWAVTGWSDGPLVFGGTRTTANTDYTRGTTASTETTGGFYAYTGTPGSTSNPSFLIQPGGNDFAPGTLTLRIQNNGTTNITQLAVSYNLFVRNDQGRASSFNFSYSADNTIYTSVPSLNYTSPEAADMLGYVQVGTSPSRMISVTGLNIAPGGFFYIRWSSDDVSGSGSRDEIALDDIAVTASFVAPQVAPTFSSANSATFTIGQANTFNITTTGSPTVTNITQTGTLPTGVMFVYNNNGTATLSGTPALGTEGTYNLVFTATNGVAPDATQNFTLTVAVPPSAASATVGGRVTEANGRGIFRARVTLIDSQGVEQTAYTNTQGYYSFPDVPGGQTYIFAVRHLRHQFAVSSFVEFIDEDNPNINFVSIGESLRLANRLSDQ
jgi:hypothetical protein